MDKHFKIYTDGSWSQAKRQIGSAGIIIDPSNQIVKTIQSTTIDNLSAKALHGEIEAIKLSLLTLIELPKRLLKKYPIIIIYHDFDQLDPNQITKVKSPLMKKYYDWLFDFTQFHSNLKIQFQKVKAHAKGPNKDKYNAYVDKLAKEAANKPKLK